MKLKATLFVLLMGVSSMSFAHGTRVVYYGGPGYYTYDTSPCCSYRPHVHKVVYVSPRVEMTRPVGWVHYGYGWGPSPSKCCF